MILRQAKDERLFFVGPKPLMLSLSKHVRWAGLFLLASCAQPPAEPKAEAIACAIDGAADFADLCTVERNGVQVIVHHPDGGFRQLEITSNGAITALDGADAAQSVAIANGMVEVQLKGDRYRFRREAPTNAPQP